MTFMLEEKHKNILEKYKNIWDKIKDLIKKDFDSEPIYDNKYLKIKMKPHMGKIKTYLFDDGLAAKITLCKCYSLKHVNSVL